MAFEKVLQWIYCIKNAELESQEIETFSVRVNDFYTPFTMIDSRAGTAGETKWVKKLKHKEHLMSLVPNEYLFVTSPGDHLTLKR